MGVTAYSFFHCPKQDIKRLITSIWSILQFLQGANLFLKGMEDLK